MEGRNTPPVKDMVYLVLLISLMGVVNMQNVPVIRPIAFTMPSPPTLMGRLSMNSVLTNAEKVHVNRTQGPSSFVNHNGNLYTATADNQIYNVARCPPQLIVDLKPRGCNGVFDCGQLISLRLHPPTGLLLALDTYRGLFAVNPYTGQHQLIFPSKTTYINGRLPVYLNDMAVRSDGVVILTDSSDAYTFAYTYYVCLDGRPTGRLIAYMPSTGEISELLPGRFNLPNGIEFTPDGDLLVTETCRASVHRISLKRQSWLQVTPFATNLPGLPDNIRASGRGTYWVPMSYPRHSGIRNPLDEHSTNPQYRLQGFNWLSLGDLERLYTRNGVIVELDESGNVLGSLHDPTGTVIAMVTEVNEFDGVLTVGSHLVPYMVRVILPLAPGSPLPVEGIIQVKRSRCQLPDYLVEAERQRLLQVQQQQQLPPQQPA